MPCCPSLHRALQFCPAFLVLLKSSPGKGRSWFTKKSTESISLKGYFSGELALKLVTGRWNFSRHQFVRGKEEHILRGGVAVWQSPRCTILFPFGKGHVAQLWGRWSAWSLQPAASSELASAKQCGLFTQSPTLPNYMHLVMSEYVCMCVSVKAQHMGHTVGGGHWQISFRTAEILVGLCPRRLISSHRPIEWVWTARGGWSWAEEVLWRKTRMIWFQNLMWCCSMRTHTLQGPQQETDKAGKQGHVGVFWGMYQNADVPRDSEVMAGIHLGGL